MQNIPPADQRQMALTQGLVLHFFEDCDSMTTNAEEIRKLHDQLQSGATSRKEYDLARQAISE